MVDNDWYQYKKILHIACLCVAICLNSANASSAFEPGAPIVQYYSAKAYKAGSINWSITQDHRGFMYFANGQGALEFDGIHWTLIPLDSGGQARSIAVDDRGTVYVGGVGEFGFLLSDADGQLKYRSLSAALPEQDKVFSNVWTIHATTHGVYFVAHKKIFRWYQGRLETLPNNKFNRGYSIHDVIYLFHFDGGISKLYDGEFTALPNSEFVTAENVGRVNILPYSESHLLMMTMNKGAYLYDIQASTFARFKTDIDQYVNDNELYYGAQMDGLGNYYFPTLNGGIAAVDRDGQLIRIINEHQAYEVNGNSVSAISSAAGLFIDKDDNLWVATHNGLVHINMQMPWTVYDVSNEARTAIIDAIRFNGYLYITSFKGIFYLPEYKLNSNDQHRFIRLNTSKQQSFRLYVHQNHLLASVQGKIYDINGDQTKELLDIKEDPVIMSLGGTPVLPDYVFAGKNSDGIDAIKLDVKQGNISAKLIPLDIPEIDNLTIRSILDDKNGDLWVVTESNGIYKIRFENSLDRYTVQSYGLQEGLPVLNNNYLVRVEDELLLYNRRGIYKTEVIGADKDGADVRFVPDLLRGKFFFENNYSILGLAQYGEHIFVKTNAGSGLLIKQNDGGYVWDTRLFSIIPNNGRSGNPSELTVYVEPDETLWQPIDTVLYRLKSFKNEQIFQPYSVSIRKVLVNDSEAIFNGNFIDIAHAANILGVVNFVAQQPEQQSINLSYQQNSIAFYFSAQKYDFKSKLEFSYKLENFDKNWSGWSSDSKKEYTNLPEGVYRFVVKAKDVYGIESEPAYYRFTIAPPWYRTLWAYAAYFALLVLLIVLIVKLRTLQITRYALKLEGEVGKRTSRIKELLDKKNESLAHVSHELRTPLTLILGPIDQLIEQVKDVDMSERLVLVKRNAQRLLKMVDQLLTLAKANVPGLIERTPQNLSKIARLIVASVKSLAIDKNIEIRNSIADDLWTEMMPDAVETILLNLCVNAIKYTPEHGRVLVDLEREGDFIILRVSDTGPGIPCDQQEKIFERFTRLSLDEKGVGLGLAVVKELVDTQNGFIEVDSELGQGAVFKVGFPALSYRPTTDEDNHDSEDGYQLAIEVEHANIQRDSVCKGLEVGEKNDELPHILIIDDEADMREYLLSIMQGYHCTLAENGVEGIEYARDQSPDLIVSDVMMPGKDGFQVLEAIRNDVNTCHIPVLLLTAKGDDQFKVKAFQELADDYITKPFNANELRMRIQGLLALRDLMQQRFSKDVISKDEGGNHSEYENLSKKDREFLHQFKAMVENNYHNNDFGVRDMVDQMHMSERPLQRKLKALLGVTPGNYLKIYRLEKAAEFLQQDDIPINQILDLVGIKSKSHFYAYFKAYFGMPPKEYQAKIK